MDPRVEMDVVGLMEAELRRPAQDKFIWLHYPAFSHVFKLPSKRGID
jgi:hypothetical protein